MIYSLGADFSPSNGIILGEAFFSMHILVGI
jgi:hypothetical protein